MDPSYRYQTIAIVESAEMFYVSLQLMQLLEGKYKQILFGSTRNFIKKYNPKIMTKFIITFVNSLVSLK